MSERLHYLGIDGKGWYVRVWSRGVCRTVRVKVFYR